MFYQLLSVFLQRAIYFLKPGTRDEFQYVTIYCSYIDVGMDDIDFIRYYFNELMDDDKLKSISLSEII